MNDNSYNLHRIVKGIYKAKDEIDKLQVEYEAKIEKCRRQVLDMQDECGITLRHRITDYTADLSGNNDSSTVCAICGKEL